MAGLYIAHWLSIAPHTVYRGRTLSRALYTALARDIAPVKTYIQHTPLTLHLRGSWCH